MTRKNRCKLVPTVLSLGGLGVVGLAGLALADGADDTVPPGFAVVELFTSEGCSSCPPADDLLAQIDTWAHENDREVYALSFHVDYWNRLGWKDPYSAATHTERQRSYAAAAGARSVYTPQMVVNGTDGFVGSDAKRATAALSDALARPTTSRIELSSIEVSDHSFGFAYRLLGKDRDGVLNVAVVQASGTQDVPRGENAGRTLRHVRIVRAFESFAIDGGAGRHEVARPVDLDGPAELVVYAQDPRTKRVLAAASAPAS